VADTKQRYERHVAAMDLILVRGFRFGDCEGECLTFEAMKALGFQEKDEIRITMLVERLPDGMESPPSRKKTGREFTFFDENQNPIVFEEWLEFHHHQDVLYQEGYLRNKRPENISGINVFEGNPDAGTLTIF
jgi:hypothetical protein